MGQHPYKKCEHDVKNEPNKDPSTLFYTEYKKEGHWSSELYIGAQINMVLLVLNQINMHTNKKWRAIDFKHVNSIK